MFGDLRGIMVDSAFAASRAMAKPSTRSGAECAVLTTSVSATQVAGRRRRPRVGTVGTRDGEAEQTTRVRRRRLIQFVSRAQVGVDRGPDHSRTSMASPNKSAAARFGLHHLFDRGRLHPEQAGPPVWVGNSGTRGSKSKKCTPPFACQLDAH